MDRVLTPDSRLLHLLHYWCGVDHDHPPDVVGVQERPDVDPQLVQLHLHLGLVVIVAEVGQMLRVAAAFPLEVAGHRGDDEYRASPYGLENRF